MCAEPPTAYAKGVVALVILTEIFRVFDFAVNWSFLSTSPGYAPFFRGDVFFILLGLALIISVIIDTKVVLAGGFAYSVGGLLITFLDPDFKYFATNPLEYLFGPEFAALLLYTVGLLILVVMLVIAVRGTISLLATIPTTREQPLRILASFLIIGSGVVHLALGFFVIGLGQATLVGFGVLYLFAGVMISSGRYIFGIVIPSAGLLSGLTFFAPSWANSAFIAVEFSVMGISSVLGFGSHRKLDG